MTEFSDLLVAIERLLSERPRVVVGISGHAGAGKSVLARRMVDAMDGAVRVRGDDFLDPVRVHRRSADWDGVERERLRSEVVEPFRAGHDVEIRRLDWNTGRLGEPTPLPRASVLVIDAIGIFHPDLLPWLDLTVWVHADHQVAQGRGMARDRAAGLDHDRLWTEVWTPNDHAFEQMFSPRTRADLVLDS
jgi:uridine kinase